MKNQLPSPQELATLFWYDIDGQLTRRVDAGRWGREKAGTVVGTPHCEGYLSAVVRGKRLLVHRVCFAIAHGQWPEGQIDHIDGNRTNNRLSNLRDVMPGENSQNRHASRSDSSTGVLGIRPMRHRWQANIRTMHPGHHHGLDGAGIPAEKIGAPFGTVVLLP